MAAPDWTSHGSRNSLIDGQKSGALGRENEHNNKKGGAVLQRRLLGIVAAGLFAAGCSSVATGPSAEAKSALTPTGKLRGGFLTVPLYASKDAGTGQFRGVAPDLGGDLARQLGVPYEPVPYASVPALMAGAKAGEWDITTMGINQERAALMDFSVAFMEVEQGFLIRAGLAINTADEVDRAGIRVGVLEKAAGDVVLTQRLKNAVIVRAASANDLFALIKNGKVDVVAGTTSRLYEELPRLPGSRVLEGRFTVEPVGMAVPKGRSAAGAQYVNRFIGEAKASGLVKRAIESAGLRGVTVAADK